MATSMRSSFVGSMSLSSSIPKFVEPRTSSRLRAVSKSRPSTTMRANEGTVSKPKREVSRFIDTGIDKQGELWWASLFNVLAEEQWSNILTRESKMKETAEQRISSTPSVTPPRTTTTVALPDLIDSTTSNKRQRAKVAFTAEKARALRKSMRASETWHDEWYHSAIATRLAEPID